MKKPLDYIQLHPQRSSAILGISFADFQCLIEQVKQVQAQHQAQVGPRKCESTDQVKPC